MDENDTGNTKAALDFARRTTEAQILKVTFEGADEEILVTKDGEGNTFHETVRDLFGDRAAAPIRRKGTIVVHDLASFIAATNRDSDANSVIFGDAPSRKVTAILDFHTAGNGAPRWGQDRIEYGFTLSPQLLAWCNAARSPMDQKTFAKLVDDRLGDVGDPASVTAGSIADDFVKRRAIQFASVSDLIVFTRTIAGKSSVVSSESYDENTGETAIQYAKKTDVTTPDGASVPVPSAFVLRIPILCGAEATEYAIAVRLRYDVESGIKWRVELHALDKYINAAIDEALAVVRAEKTATPNGCGLPVFMGTAPPA